MKNLLLVVFCFIGIGLSANDTIPTNIYGGLKFRSLDPAFVSGRISDFAVNPDNPSEYYVGVAAGGIWKTTNNGTTFKPIFDGQSVYSIGCLKLDPKNPNVIWAGTGENNHQRSISYGDGVYKSLDGGKSWKNMGLKESMQIGMIAIDPRNSDVVYVAAEGSVWGPGGDRGLYKTIDGGANWEKILEISENTGVNNVYLDFDNADVIYVTTEQRRRRTQTRIGGGPESGIRKSTDGGKTWRKIESGIPAVAKGGIDLALSPVDHNIIYAIVEAAEGKGGFFRSKDKGESWQRMSDYNTSGQYFCEIYCDLFDVDRVYSTEMRSKYTVDGGKTWKNMGGNKRHVDDHAFWQDPSDARHYMIGGDGGVYETFDDGAEFIHKTNLPVTQFYRVGLDNAEPFYFVYGGTQDNSSLGGPSGTLYRDGITRGEWVITLGGDGFWQNVDPENPDIVYSEYQYGNLFRHDKKSGEITYIKPQPRKGEESYKWNWNSPVILSPHGKTRLYMASNKVFRSDDRGQSWEVISDDITRGIDRNHWKVMDRYWGVDAVAKDVSTSLYGMGVSLEESPVKEGLLYVGTDDGLLSMTEDNGKTWQKTTRFGKVPEYTYISDILASKYDENVVYASFDNRKHNDFKPYILKSTNKGKTWKSIVGNLPENHPVHTIQQDFENPDLLFAGTEFGIFFTVDEGEHWIQLKSGIPTIAVRDIAIQKRENDLVLATFGRGFYILDDYSSLRKLTPELTENDAVIFPVKDTKLYYQKNRGGYGFGSMIYKSKNPDFGAVFTYYIKEAPKTLQAIRREKEKELIKNKERIPIPSLEELRAEEEEISPYLTFTIRGADGKVIRKINKSVTKGINRVVWNMREGGKNPEHLKGGKFDPLKGSEDGLMVLPGKYTVDLSLTVRGEMTKLVDGVEFELIPLNNATLPANNMAERKLFLDRTMDLARAVFGARSFTGELAKRVDYLKQSAVDSREVDLELLKKIDGIDKELSDIAWQFRGEIPKASPEEKRPGKVTINDRLGYLMGTLSRSNSAVTMMQKEAYKILSDEFPDVLVRLKKISEIDIPDVQRKLEDIDAPWVPGQLPKWNKK